MQRNSLNFPPQKEVKNVQNCNENHVDGLNFIIKAEIEHKVGKF